VFQNGPNFIDWQVSNNGNYEVHGYQGTPGDPTTWNASDYSTDVISGEVVKFINEAGADNKPFFAWVSPYPPHSPSLPAPRHYGSLNGRNFTVPKNPNFNPSDAIQSGKAATAVGRYPQYSANQVAAMDFTYQSRAESLLSCACASAAMRITRLLARINAAKSQRSMRASIREFSLTDATARHAPGRRRPRGRGHCGARGHQPAEQHVRHFHVGQWLPSGPVPHVRRQDVAF
jgi:hypothetical protein